MGSVVDAREDSIFNESQRTSLLDIIEERNRTLNKKILLHRVVFISKIRSQQNFQDIGGYYEKWFREVQSQLQVEPVTGLLLLFPKHCIHVLESSADVLLEMAKDLVDQSKDGTLHMEKSRILIVSHDIPHRLYQHWSHRVLDIEAPRLDAYEPTDEPARLINEMLVQLLKLGTYLSRQPKVAAKNAMDTLNESRPDLVPQQDLLAWLLENEEDLKFLITPQLYLEHYTKPYDLVLASNLVWPLPTKLFQYSIQTT